MKFIRRIIRFVFISFALLALGYSAVFGITLLRFSTANVDGTRYFFHESSEAEISSLHTLAMQNLQISGLYEGAPNATVILTQSPFEYRVLSFFRNARAFGNSFAPLSYIVIAPSNIGDDTVITASERYNQRILHGVLTHEFVHLLLYSHFGLDTLVQIPVWKVEGYADYIAQEGSFPEGDGEFLRRGERQQPVFRIFQIPEGG